MKTKRINSKTAVKFFSWLTVSAAGVAVGAVVISKIAKLLSGYIDLDFNSLSGYGYYSARLDIKAEQKYKLRIKVVEDYNTTFIPHKVLASIPNPDGTYRIIEIDETKPFSINVGRTQLTKNTDYIFENGTIKFINSDRVFAKNATLEINCFFKEDIEGSTLTCWPAMDQWIEVCKQDANNKFIATLTTDHCTPFSVVSINAYLNDWTAKPTWKSTGHKLIVKSNKIDNIYANGIYVTVNGVALSTSSISVERTADNKGFVISLGNNAINPTDTVYFEGIYFHENDTSATAEYIVE